MNKKIWIPLATSFLVVFAFIQVGLWGSHGGFLDFIQGQLDSDPDLSTFSHSKAGKNGNVITVKVSIDTQKPIHRVAPEYLSFAIDSSQIVGGKWWNPEADKIEMGSGSLHAPVFDFNRPRLDILTQALTPAYLRIGGSEADKIYYDLSGAETPKKPEGYHSVMTKSQWDQVNQFVKRNQLKLVFTLNVGPSSRRKDGSWDPKNAESLLKYSAENNFSVNVWEMGNELNLYWYIYGPSAQVPVEQYHQDLTTGRKLVKKYYPDALFSGQGSAYWPLLGEPLSFFFSFMPDYMEQSGSLVDVVSWHYYPQQSRRGLIASRRAKPSRLLNLSYLNEVKHWGQKIQKLRDQFSPGKPVWLGESGNAQFGGEPGLSDRYLGGLWWLDELGLLAQTGHHVVVRQTLSGMNYGMIESDSLEINPDYWNSLLWKRLMGQDVYKTDVKGSKKLRVYAHKHPNLENTITILLINLDHENTIRTSLKGNLSNQQEVYQLDTDDIFSKNLYLNGEKLQINNDRLPQITGKINTSPNAQVLIKPLSYAFIVSPIN